TTAWRSAGTNSGGSSWIAVTPIVFCAVSATIALIPWQPAAANAFRSAWMPAPPPESDEAIVSARATISAPFAGITRIRFGGCVLSLSERHPGRRSVASGERRNCDKERRQSHPLIYEAHGHERHTLGRPRPGRGARAPRDGARARGAAR